MAHVEPHKLPVRFVETTRIIWQDFHWLVLIGKKVDLPVNIPYREPDV